MECGERRGLHAGKGRGFEVPVLAGASIFLDREEQRPHSKTYGAVATEMRCGGITGPVEAWLICVE